MSRGAGREGESFCYVTTRGRRSGRPHTIEIWFGGTGTSLYLLSGGGERSDWVKNLRIDPSVMVRVGDQDQRPARARVVEDPEEEVLARRLLASKYQGWHEGRQMSEWARTALPVAVDLGDPPSG